MDLRRFVLILIHALAAAHAVAAPTKSYPLDERSVYTVRLSREEPTTCVFPGALKAIVGANVSAKIEDNPAVLLSHEVGADYFCCARSRKMPWARSTFSFADESMR